MKISRRSMLGGISSLIAGLTLGFTETFSTSKDLPKGSTILFQGDSITDAGRERGAYYANDYGGMGQGYVRHIVTELLAKHPDKDLKIYNRGISGHKVYQLRDRWEDDCMMLKPDILSILIGVNDHWHTLSGRYGGVGRPKSMKMIL